MAQPDLLLATVGVRTLVVREACGYDRCGVRRPSHSKSEVSGQKSVPACHGRISLAVRTRLISGCLARDEHRGATGRPCGRPRASRARRSLPESPRSLAIRETCGQLTAGSGDPRRAPVRGQGNSLRHGRSFCRQGSLRMTWIGWNPEIPKRRATEIPTRSRLGTRPPHGRLEATWCPLRSMHVDLKRARCASLIRPWHAGC